MGMHKRCRATEPVIFPHRDSFLCKPTKLHQDDDTVSTVTSSSFDESDSSFSTVTGVSFAEPLVTQVWLRPYTTKQEKRVLFYNERDFMEFKRDYYYGRNRLVSFADSVVSNVWTIPPVADSSKAFYSENELQQFLDEFVESLEKGMGMD